MASSKSNRHWPSMFRSKHAGQPWHAQTDMAGSPPSLLSGSSAGSSGCSLKSPLSSGGEERAPDPKPRWNPRPEQIRILEAIFNSGMVNPPRDEIPRIRMQLQEYGQVGDANVFYWFQNRKSRSKNKLRSASGHRLGARACAPAAAAAASSRDAVAPFTPPPVPPQPVQPQQLLVSHVTAPTSSSSSSSDRSSGSSRPVKRPAAQAVPTTGAMDLLSPLAAACNQQLLYQGQPLETAPALVPASKVHGILASDEPIFVQWPQGTCLSAINLGAAILGGQYMHLPVPIQQQPLPSAGMFRGLCNDMSGANNTGHKSCAWSAGHGQQCSPGAADQLGLDKISAATIAAVPREQAHDDAMKLGLLQYGFGITTPAMHVDLTSAAAGALPLLASSPDAAVTVAREAATTDLTEFAANTDASNELQGIADFGVDVAAGAGATAARGCTVGNAVVCVGLAGTAASFVFPAAHFNVRHYFGEAAVLLRYSGDCNEPVRVDEAGVTAEPLQPGAVYLVLM